MKTFIYTLIGILLLFGALHIVLSKPVSEKVGFLGNNTLGIQISFGDPNISTNKFPDFFEENINKLLKDKSGQYSIFIKHISTKQTVLINANERFYLASLYKIPVAIATLQDLETGKLHLEDKIKYSAEDIYYGTGTIQYDSVGTEYTVEELLKRLLKESDNIAQSMLLTKVDKKNVDLLIPDLESVGVLQIGALLEGLYNHEYLNQQNSSLIFEYLTETAFDDRVSVGLANGVTFAHKIGSWGETGSWHDCGVILDNSNPLVVCIMSKNTTYEEFLSVSREIGQNINKILY